jgi:hypothetical protein
MRAAPNSPPDAFAALAEDSEAAAESTSSASDDATAAIDSTAAAAADDATVVDKQTEHAGKLIEVVH